MKARSIPFLLGFLFLTLTACGEGSRAGQPARAVAPKAQPIPPDLAVHLKQSAELGRELYILDKVAAIATDALIAEKGDVSSLNLGGYLPFFVGGAKGQPSKAFSVVFVDREEPPRIKFEVAVEVGKAPRLRELDPPQEPDELIAMLFAARQVAIRSMPTPKQPYNPLVLRAAALGKQGALVYLLAGTTVPGVAVFGMHYRAIVDYGAAQVTELQPLSKGEFLVPTRSPQGKPASMLMVTHVVTDWPLETHVLVSLQTGLPVYVGTKRGMFAVKGDNIEFWGEFERKGDHQD